MSKPIDIRFWENEITSLLELLRQAIINDLDFLIKHIDEIETEQFSTAVAVLNERREVYAKFSEHLMRANDGVTE